MSKKKRKQVYKKPQSRKKGIKQSPLAKPTKSSIDLNLWIEKNAGYIYTALFLLLVFFIYRNFWTLKDLFIFKDIGSDTVNTFYPAFVQRARLIHGHESLYYSFYSGMGRAVSIGWFTFLRAPFQALYFLLPPDKTAYGIFFVVMTELFFTAFFFYRYLILIKMDKKVAIIGALFLSFSAVIVLGGTWYIQFYNVLLFSFMLWAFEKWFMQDKIAWYPLSLFFIFETKGIVFIAVFLLFLFFYSLLRFFEERDFSIKKFIQFYAILGGLTLLGIAMNAYLGYASTKTLLAQPRVSGEYSQINKNASQSIFALGDKLMYITEIMRTFGNNLMGSGKVFRQIGANGQSYLMPDFKGWQYNYFEAPWTYLGLLSLLLFPQIFTTGNRKQKIARATFLFLWFLPLIFPYIRKAMWGYAGNYFRFESLYYSFPFLYFSLGFLSDKKAKLNTVLLGSNLIVLLILLFYPYQLEFKNAIQSSQRNFTGFILIAEAVTLYLLYNTDLKKWGYTLLLILIFVEIAFNSSSAVNDRLVLSKSEFKAKIGYNDYTMEALKWLKFKDEDFYRINKDYQSGSAVHGSMNDAEAQGYFGTKSYKSFQQPNYLRALEKFNIIKPHDETAGRWAVGFSNRPILQIIANVKYNLSKSAKPEFLRFGYEKINELGDVKILKNKYSLPFGFTYSQVITEKQHQKLSPVQKDFTSLQACIGDSTALRHLTGLKYFKLSDTLSTYNWKEIQNFTDNLKTDTLKITSFKQDDIKGEIELSNPKIIFFSIPFDKSWHLSDNGQRISIFRANYGFIGAKLSKGKHKLRLYFFPREREKSMLWLSLFFWLIFIGLVVYSKFKKQ